MVSSAIVVHQVNSYFFTQLPGAQAVIYLQFYTCASQDSLGLYKVSPIENNCVHYRIFHYNFVSPGTRWDLKCQSQSKNVSMGLGMRR